MVTVTGGIKEIFIKASEIKNNEAHLILTSEANIGWTGEAYFCRESNEWKVGNNTK